jgi:hypothetical protein
MDKSNLNSNIKITIGINKVSFIYDKKTYKPDLLNKIVTKHEWENLISEASRMMGQSWSKKKFNDKISLPKFMSVFASISVILTIIYTATLYSAAISEGESTALLGISIASISVGTLISAILATYNFFRKLSTFHTLDEIMEMTMKDYLGSLNIKYQGKLEFIYIPETKIIECSILSKKISGEIEMDEKKLFTTENDKEIIGNKREENGARKSSSNS